MNFCLIILEWGPPQLLFWISSSDSTRGYPRKIGSKNRCRFICHLSGGLPGQLEAISDLVLSSGIIDWTSFLFHLRYQFSISCSLPSSFKPLTRFLQKPFSIVAVYLFFMASKDYFSKVQGFCLVFVFFWQVYSCWRIVASQEVRLYLLFWKEYCSSFRVLFFFFG